MHISVFEYRIRDIDGAGWAMNGDELAPCVVVRSVMV
jgi:hypothetical protein